MGMKINDEHLAKKYLMLKARCRAKRIPFNLTLSDIRTIYRRNTCAYTGVNLIINASADNTRLGNEATFDRIEPSKGYVKGNVVLCAHDVNLRKGNLSLDEMRNIIKVADK